MEGWREEVGVGPTVSRVEPIAPQARNNKDQIPIMINLDMQFDFMSTTNVPDTSFETNSQRIRFLHLISSFNCLHCTRRGLGYQGNSCEVIKNSSLFFAETFKIDHTTNSVMLRSVCSETHGVQSTFQRQIRQT